VSRISVGAPKRYARRAGVTQRICCHTFRATEITAYLRAGGTLERAAAIAAHESTRTTQLYNRTDDEISLDEIAWIVIYQVIQSCNGIARAAGGRPSNLVCPPTTPPTEDSPSRRLGHSIGRRCTAANNAYYLPVFPGANCVSTDKSIP